MSKKSVNMKNLTNPCLLPNNRPRSRYSRNQRYQFAFELTHQFCASLLLDLLFPMQFLMTLFLISKQTVFQGFPLSSKCLDNCVQHTAQVVGHYSGTQKTEFLMIHKDIDESEGQGREEICPPPKVQQSAFVTYQTVFINKREGVVMRWKEDLGYNFSRDPCCVKKKMDNILVIEVGIQINISDKMHRKSYIHK